MVLGPDLDFGLHKKLIFCMFVFQVLCLTTWPSNSSNKSGVAPSAVQQAAMQGGQVVMGQKEGGVLNGSGSGGYTFW